MKEVLRIALAAVAQIEDLVDGGGESKTLDEILIKNKAVAFDVIMSIPEIEMIIESILAEEVDDD